MINYFHIILGLINYRYIAFLKIYLDALKKSPYPGPSDHKNDFYRVDCTNEIQEIATIKSLPNQKSTI